MFPYLKSSGRFEGGGSSSSVNVDQCPKSAVAKQKFVIAETRATVQESRGGFRVIAT